VVPHHRPALADKLSQAFGQQFVIENRGGASGIIGTDAAAGRHPTATRFCSRPRPAQRHDAAQDAYDPVKTSHSSAASAT
jgi:tripartite-type tricarboxylate transporter receptor subunit TctC